MNRSFSEDDAQRIFALAAERQQAAKTEVRPQLTLADLEEAGQAAGLDPAHIRAAAADLLRPDRLPVHRKFLGVPTEIRRTQVFAEPLSPATRQKLLGAVRHTFGTEGVLTELENGFEWASTAKPNQAPFRVFVEEEGAGSRVTFERNKWSQVLGFGGGFGTMFITFLVISLSAFITGDSDPAIVGGIFMALALVIGIGGFAGLRWFGEKEVNQFNQLMAQVELWQRAELDEALPAPSAPVVDLDAHTEGYTLDEAQHQARDGNRTESH